jgi:hypothetical protein
MKESVKHFIKNEEKMTIYEQNEMISLVWWKLKVNMCYFWWKDGWFSNETE